MNPRAKLSFEINQALDFLDTGEVIFGERKPTARTAITLAADKYAKAMVEEELEELKNYRTYKVGGDFGPILTYHNEVREFVDTFDIDARLAELRKEDNPTSMTICGICGIARESGAVCKKCSKGGGE